jgi:hypothetical protein
MNSQPNFVVRVLGIILGAVVLALVWPDSASAEGTWIPLQTNAPNGIGTMLLLSDGTVMAQFSGNVSGQNSNWFKLTPGSTGGYTNGFWTNLNSMHYTRLFYSSDVLTNGQVFIAGGEDGTGNTNAEIYDPPSDSWAVVPVSANVLGSTGSFLDSGSVLLSNGKVLVTPVFPATGGETVTYDPVTGNWSSAELQDGQFNEDEASMVKLPDDSILVTDGGTQDSERYIPSLNQWVEDGSVPVPLFDDVGGEEGAAFLLPNGNAFYLGSTPNTALYTPSGSTNPGTWQPGPEIPHSYGAPDAPAAMMVNGKILCAFSQSPYFEGTNKEVFNMPTYFYEYDYSAGLIGSFNQIHSPNHSLTYPVIPNFERMLDLPDGTVLFADGGSSLYVYVPDLSPLPAGQPTIASVSWNADGSLQLTGTLFNGISQGASFGDDVQMDSNYPLVRFTDVSGHVSYGRTFNWNCTSVQTGSRIVTTQCWVPPKIYDNPGTFSLQVVANGNASAPVTFYSPVWVNFNYTGNTQNGTFAAPYKTLANATNAVATGGTIAIYAGVQPSTSAATIAIFKPMKIISVSGPSTIGD